MKDGQSTQAIQDLLAAQTKKEFEIKINVTHSIMLQFLHREARLDRRWPVSELKVNLEYLTGTKSQFMTLHLKNNKDEFIAELKNMDETLQHYSAENYWTLHVVDSDPNSALIGLEDLSQVQKYEISDEDYDKRDDTFRKWRDQKVKDDPNFGKPQEVVPDY